MKTKSPNGFTLVELLVVIAIVAILASLLMPAISRAKQRVQMTKCLNNLHQIDIAIKLYVEDNRETYPPGDSWQFVKTGPFIIYGNSLGGTDPSPDQPQYPPEKDRLLNPYVRVRELWHCPADRGIEPPIGGGPSSAYQFCGSSYRFNWDLQTEYETQTPLAEDPYYNLSGKKENWAPNPSRFIMMTEHATYFWNLGPDQFGVTQWHYSSHPGKIFTPDTIRTDGDKFIAPIAFTDGHCQSVDFTRNFKENPYHPLEPGKDFQWYKSLR